MRLTQHMQIDTRHRGLSHSVDGQTLDQAGHVAGFDVEDVTLSIARMAVLVQRVAVQAPTDRRQWHALDLANHLEDGTNGQLQHATGFGAYTGRILHLNGVHLQRMIAARHDLAVVISCILGLHIGYLQAAIRPEHDAFRRRHLWMAGIDQQHIVPVPAYVARGGCSLPGGKIVYK